MVSIKIAGHSDVSIIRALAEKIWWPTYSSIVKEEQIHFMLNHLYSEKSLTEAMTNGETFLMLHDNSGYQGFISFSSSKNDLNTWKINKLYVLPENHGSGYGKKLMAEVADRARKAGMTSLILNVNRYNPALNFYKKLGFTIVQEEDVPVGPYWMNDYVMMITL